MRLWVLGLLFLVSCGDGNTLQTDQVQPTKGPDPFALFAQSERQRLENQLWAGPCGEPFLDFMYQSFYEATEKGFYGEGTVFQVYTEHTNEALIEMAVLVCLPANPIVQASYFQDRFREAYNFGRTIQ